MNRALAFPDSLTSPIIRLMPQWTLNSNVADVLSLGPRTAGRLMQVGVRTVADLLAAKPQVVARRLGVERLSVSVVEGWQREAQLIVAVPQLSPRGARILAALGYYQPEKVARCAPTALLAATERATGAEESASWLAETTLPTISELADWIHCAQQSIVDRAA